MLRASYVQHKELKDLYDNSPRRKTVLCVRTCQTTFDDAWAATVEVDYIL